MMTYLFLFVMILFPPLFVHLVTNDRDRTTVSFMCTGFLFVPGYIHAFYVGGEHLILKYNEKKRQKSENYKKQKEN